MGRLSYLIIICPLAQKMQKCILLVFTDSFSEDIDLNELLLYGDVRGQAVLVDKSDENISLLIDIKGDLPIIEYAVSV